MGSMVEQVQMEITHEKNKNKKKRKKCKQCAHFLVYTCNLYCIYM